MDIPTFYNRISSFTLPILKHNVLILDGDMNADIGKDENHKFCLLNYRTRNDEYPTDFSLENSLSCLNTKYKKKKKKKRGQENL